MSIFENAHSQYIDENGKCRALIYDNISLATSPLPPLDLPQVGLDKIIIAPIEVVKQFVKQRNLKIVEQDGSEEESIIQGVWVVSKENPSPISFGYIQVEIPNEGTNALPKINFSQQETTDPLLVGSESDLEDMRRNSKIANYLKQYSLIKWANNPTKFNIDSFHINPNHVYEIQTLRSRIDMNNDVIFHDGKIIVHDLDTANRLIMYVKVTSLNDSSIKNRYIDRKTIDGSTLYTSITDFKRDKKQLVFMSTDAVLQWKMEKSRDLVNTNVHSQSKSNVKEPYYYRNLQIADGKLMIIQNTYDGSFSSALAVSKMWETSTINPGYKPDEFTYIPDKDLAFEVYTEDGKTHESSIKGTKQNPLLRVFAYNNGSYGALLFL